jgi:tRNA threonylcarbamoyladenosine dehydratase
MTKWLARTELLLGKEALAKLNTTHVLVVGLGGVGAYAAEQLCRAGIGEMTIVDADVVDETNINRQLIALTSTIGNPKTELLKDRLLQINPNLKLHVVQEYIIDESTEELLNRASYDYVLDAIDTLSPKVFLIYVVLQKKYPLISAMGAGGKLDPSKIQVVDINKTFQCKLAFIVRKRLHQLGIRTGFKAVFSPEIVPEHAIVIDSNPSMNKLSVVGTISYMPAMFGCHMAAEVIKDLIK